MSVTQKEASEKGETEMRIGFDLLGESKKAVSAAGTATAEESLKTDEPVRSVVSVFFPARGFSCSYYNDCFCLSRGDLVFVEGKLEGLVGRIEEVNRSFKIRLSDYKKVIAKADTHVNGELFFGKDSFIAFDRSVIPYEKVRSWFLPPVAEEEEYVRGTDDVFFPAEALFPSAVSKEIFERGIECCNKRRVAYLCLDRNRVRALVLGRNVYEVEFEYKSGEIGNFNCSCWNGGICKHDVAAAVALEEALKTIEEQYSEEYKNSGYFAAVDRVVFDDRAVHGKERGKITVSDK